MREVIREVIREIIREVIREVIRHHPARTSPFERKPKRLRSRPKSCGRRVEAPR